MAKNGNLVLLALVGAGAYLLLQGKASAASDGDAEGAAPVPGGSPAVPQSQGGESDGGRLSGGGGGLSPVPSAPSAPAERDDEDGGAPAVVRPAPSVPAAVSSARADDDDELREAAELAASRGTSAPVSAKPATTSARTSAPSAAVVPVQTSPSSVAPVVVPQRAAPPAGYSASAARAMSQGLAKHIAQKQYSYTRSEVLKFQRAAGIPADGIYGPLTQSALRYYGATAAPKALFKAGAGQPTTYQEP